MVRQNDLSSTQPSSPEQPEGATPKLQTKCERLATYLQDGRVASQMENVGVMADNHRLSSCWRGVMVRSSFVTHLFGPASLFNFRVLKILPPYFISHV